MEISSWGIYWMLMLDNFHGGALALLVLTAVISIIIGFVMWLGNGINKPTQGKILITMGSTLVVLGFMFGFFLPTTKQMAVIIVAPAIINNEQVQKIPKDILEILNLSLDEVKQSIKGETHEKANKG